MEHLPEFIANHWALVLALVLISGLILVYELILQPGGAQLSPQEAVMMINHEHACVADIREKDAFKQAYIVDSIQVDKTKPAHPKLKKCKEKPVILVCQKGITATQALKTFQAEGYQKLYVLKGGIDAWREAGLPLLSAASNDKQ